MRCLQEDLGFHWGSEQERDTDSTEWMRLPAHPVSTKWDEPPPSQPGNTTWQPRASCVPAAHTEGHCLRQQGKAGPRQSSRHWCELTSPVSTFHPLYPRSTEPGTAGEGARGD